MSLHTHDADTGRRAPTPTGTTDQLMVVVMPTRCNVPLRWKTGCLDGAPLVPAGAVTCLLVVGRTTAALGKVRALLSGRDAGAALSGTGRRGAALGSL